MSAPKGAVAEREPRFKLFRRRRGGVVLTRAQVREIKAGRKKLRKELRAAGIRSKYEFETTASTMGLYFDKPRFRQFLKWLFGGKGIWWLLGSAALLLAALTAMSLISQMRGYFTINLSDGLFKEGFLLSSTSDFAQPMPNLFAEPAVDVPCISISGIQADIDEYEGQHNGAGYFAYTYFLRNEGESTVDYKWQLQVVGESLGVSKAIWVMVFEDGQMTLYAEAKPDGSVQAVPEFGNDQYGYMGVPVMNLARDASQLQPIAQVNGFTYYRVVTQPFINEATVAEGSRTGMAPMDVHKYTIVAWLEGDDPDCTDELIGGHFGLNMQYALVEESMEEEESFWDRLWDKLIFWDDAEGETGTGGLQNLLQSWGIGG